MSYETRYAAMKRARSERIDNLPETIEFRTRYQEVLDKARADVNARYPERTPGNALAALDYQDERIDYWRKELIG